VSYCLFQTQVKPTIAAKPCLLNHPFGSLNAHYDQIALAQAGGAAAASEITVKARIEEGHGILVNRLNMVGVRAIISY
jgi:hypothetical protein